MDNFDLKKYLVENKVTTNSRMLNEKVTTFTLTYNTDQDDLDHVEGLLRKAGIDVVRVEAGTFDDEVEITINKDHLKKAKQALRADGFDISEGKESTHSETMNEADTTFTLTYNTDPDDLEYVERMLSKKGIPAKVTQGTFDEDVEITVDKKHLKKAKQALEDAGFDV